LEEGRENGTVETERPSPPPFVPRDVTPRDSHIPPARRSPVQASESPEPPNPIPRASGHQQFSIKQRLRLNPATKEMEPFGEPF
jgi:hypothetical protein